eukprot:TRINITY_DN20321_c0_g1_i1.p1 TRINITY_DN20321_c0_g1~~TRINITY_DN20321_c0_g1_i1.p1  ORF type:complete len:577 (-),score=102.62 TRINITY_DN20321_c0_g1_i1:340-2070(-)
MLRSLVGSEMCIRDRYQRRVRGRPVCSMEAQHLETDTRPENGALPSAMEIQSSMEIEAVCCGDVDTLNQLLESKMDPNMCDSESKPALHLAADAQTARALLAANANPNSTDSSGHSAWHTAAFGNKLEVMSALVDHGAEVNLMSDGEYSPLHLAARFGHPATVQLLLAAKANPLIRDKHNQTPLEVAVEHSQQIQVPRLLLAAQKAWSHQEQTLVKIEEVSEYLCAETAAGGQCAVGSPDQDPAPSPPDPRPSPPGRRPPGDQDHQEYQEHDVALGTVRPPSPGPEMVARADKKFKQLDVDESGMLTAREPKPIEGENSIHQLPVLVEEEDEQPGWNPSSNCHVSSNCKDMVQLDCVIWMDGDTVQTGRSKVRMTGPTSVTVVVKPSTLFRDGWSLSTTYQAIGEAVLDRFESFHGSIGEWQITEFRQQEVQCEPASTVLPGQHVLVLAHQTAMTAEPSLPVAPIVEHGPGSGSGVGRGSVAIVGHGLPAEAKPRFTEGQLEMMNRSGSTRLHQYEYKVRVSAHEDLKQLRIDRVTSIERTESERRQTEHELDKLHREHAHQINCMFPIGHPDIYL